MANSISVRPSGFPEFTIVATTTAEELECYRKNNSSRDAKDLLRSDLFDEHVLHAALSTENLLLIKYIIDLKPGFVNLGLSHSEEEFDIGDKSDTMTLTPLSYVVNSWGYGAKCDEIALQIITFLCARGADVNKLVDSATPYRDLLDCNFTPLYETADRLGGKNPEWIKTLICFGARLPIFSALPKDISQKYEPENLAVRDIPRQTVYKVERHVKNAWDALYAEHRNIYLVKFGVDNNSEFKDFPAEVFMHFARASIEYCYKSNYKTI